MIKQLPTQVPSRETVAYLLAVRLSTVCMEQTLIFMKPDAVVRRYTGARVLNQLTKNRNIVHYEVVQPHREFLDNEHYGEHEGKQFYDWLLNYTSAGPLHVLILEERNIIEMVREQLGSTRPDKATPDSLRGEYGIYGGLNAAHASDSPENAAKEIKLWSSTLDDNMDGHQERLNRYVDKYLDYPQVDPARYRELTQQYINDEIEESRVRSAFITLLARESDVSSRKIETLAGVMIDNAKLER